MLGAKVEGDGADDGDVRYGGGRPGGGAWRRGGGGARGGGRGGRGLQAAGQRQQGRGGRGQKSGRSPEAELQACGNMIEEV